MRQLSIKHKSLLKKIALQVQKDVTGKFINDNFLKIKPLNVTKTSSYGWCIEIFKFKRLVGGGTLGLWLDLFSNVNRPVLCLAYRTRHLQRINAMAEALFTDFEDNHPSRKRKIKDLEFLDTPLPRKYFDRYLIENYTFKYLTYYFKNVITTEDVISVHLKEKIYEQTKWLLQVIPTVFEIKSDEDDYSAFENSIVAAHKKRERSRTLANKAKIRDAFTCRVCDLNFAEKYGERGRGIAEAHHIISLADLETIVQTRVKDLVTVCPNCHRVLHKMEGRKHDYLKLRKLLQGK